MARKEAKSKEQKKSNGVEDDPCRILAVTKCWLRSGHAGGVTFVNY